MESQPEYPSTKKTAPALLILCLVSALFPLAAGALDAIAGSNGSIQGVNVSNDEREIVYLQPTVNYQMTPSFLLEVAARVPLCGQNFPAGPQFMVAVFHRPAGGN